jgi:hypothetical protein
MPLSRGGYEKRVRSWGLARNLAPAVRQSLAEQAATGEVRACVIIMPSGVGSAEPGAVSLPNGMRMWRECINAGPSCQQKCGRPVPPEQSVPVTLEATGPHLRPVERHDIEIFGVRRPMPMAGDDLLHRRSWRVSRVIVEKG